MIAYKFARNALLNQIITKSIPKHVALFSSVDCGPPTELDDIVHFEDRKDLFVPSYPVRDNEPLNIRKQRLLYQSRKRGMLENDLLLSTFAAKYLKSMNESQVKMYDSLINQVSNDWDIYYWATLKKPTPIEYDNEIMEMLKLHVQNKSRQSLRMPDLDDTNNATPPTAAPSSSSSTTNR